MPQSKNRFQIKLDGVIKTDPENWINFTPTTERHSIYRSLLTTFSEGTVRLIKDAKNYVDASYNLYGSTATIELEWLEYDYATNAYVSIFSLGRLNLSEKYKRSRDYTEVGFEPTSFIMNVLNRDEIKTSLQSLIDIDGDAITTFTDETHTVSISDQYIDFTSKHTDVGILNVVPSYQETETDTTIYLPIPLFAKEVINEDLITVLDITTGFIGFIPDSQISFKESGDVAVTWSGMSITITYSRTPAASPDGLSSVYLVYKINNGSEVVLDSDINAFTGDTDSIVLSASSASLSGIVASDEIRFYIKIVVIDEVDPVTFDAFATEIETKLIQTTIYEDTDCEVMFPWEVFLRLCQKITGRNDCLRSVFFGRTDGEVKTYGSDGDGAFYAITTPKLLRGFPISTNPINADLMSIFKGFDKMLLLGLGVVYESGVPYISIERLEHFMDGTSSATTFEAAYPGIEWESAIAYIWGNIKGGYSKYKLEKSPTLNSPHSPRNYSVPYLSEFSSNQFNNTCDFIASGHLIEILRRDRYTNSNDKDSPYDEDLVVIHLKRNGGTFERVLATDFSTISNINNSATNSNLHLTPARNLLRQAPLLLAGLAKRIIDTPAFTGLLRYESGDGNTEAETTVTGDTLVPEDGDLTRVMAGQVYSNTPLFDASEMGNCTVAITKAQRQLIKEGLLTEITVTDNGVTYTGFIESIKEVDLEKGIAELKFLSNTGL